MNILALCNQSEAIQIMKTIKCDKYFFICPIKIKQNQLPKNLKIGIDVWAYSHRSMKKGYYYPKMDWNKIDPLDEELIINLLECESQTMRMIERIKRLRPILYENRRKYYINNLRYWSHVLQNNKISIFYRCAPPHEGYDNVISHLCDYYNIPAFYGNPFHTHKGKYRYFARYVKDNFPNFYNTTVTNGENEIELIEPLADLLDIHWNKKKIPVLPTIIPRKKVKRQKILLIRNKKLLNYYNNKCVIPDLTKPYIYFPLHYQYEATTCPMGGPFVDQWMAIEILSRLGIQIYVKEHPRISKNRDMNYYIRLLKMPNVNFISIKSNNYSLIDNSIAVATITGTAGWEAILRGKPSFIFGNIFYQYAPGVYKINGMKTAMQAYNEVKYFKANKKEIELFLKKLQYYLFKHTTNDIIAALKENIININNSEDRKIFIKE